MAKKWLTRQNFPPHDFVGRGTAAGGGGVFLKLEEGPSTSFAGPPPLQMQGRILKAKVVDEPR